MKSLVDLLEHLLQECGRRSGAPIVRDVETLRERVEHEGDSFITITLPRFCRDFERSLAEGRIVPGLFLSFGKTKSGIPEFLQGFLHNVFDKEGNLLPEPSIDCIRLVRQICLFGKKVLRPCDEARTEDAIEQFAQCDSDVVDPPQDQLRRYFILVAAELLRGIHQDREEILSRLVPKHGPGATQERIRGNAKWRFRRWHKRLEDVGITYARFGRGSSSLPSIEEFNSWPDIVSLEDEAPSRVVPVPKTMSAPRIIAVEPVCMQYVQQALSDYLEERLFSCPATRGHLEFKDQSINQGLALNSSGSGIYSTLDMSEASDRVTVAHVYDLLQSVPEFRDMAFAARSRRAQLPNGETLTLKKFASMGSALCFPIEALVFFTTIIASRIRRAGSFPTAQTVYSFSRSVYVYGDDLIVPSDEAPAICADLEHFGFKINQHKSFWTGKFRESCGADCYDNELVTPCYLRRDIPANRGDASGIVSAVSTANQLYRAGFPETATLIRNEVERITGSLPGIPADSPALGWHVHSTYMPPRRFNRDYQRWEYRCWCVAIAKDQDPLEGDPALAKCFRIIGLETIDERHLEESPRPYSLTLKRRWVPLNILSSSGSTGG